MIFKILAPERPRVFIRLYKVDENRLFWIFFFRDPVNLFMQSIIVPKEAPAQGMEDAWDRMHESFRDRLEEAL